MATKRIACLGDPGQYPAYPATPTHSGVIKTAGQSTVCVKKVLAATEAGTFECSNPSHNPPYMVNKLIAVTVKSRIGGGLIITETAMSTCGCIIYVPDPTRNVFVE